MIKIIDEKELNGRKKLNFDLSAQKDIEIAVDDIISNVIERGDKALFDYTEKFDGVKLNDLTVSEVEIENAFKNVDRYFIETLEIACENIIKFHMPQLDNGYDFEINGCLMGQRVNPIDLVGVYCPGGTASYPSSVLMNIIPAKIAGVSEIYMVTPPNENGTVKDEILVAAKVSGADRIYKIGGAQAVAALAFGTETVKRVDKIVGPGNIFVATAKRKVFGICDIDMIAGPSEITVISDRNSDSFVIAADMLSQAEHDVMSSSVLITDCRDFAESVAFEIEKQLQELPRYEIAKKSIENNGIIVIVDDLDHAADIVNESAPEHLEICVDDPFSFMKKIRHAGCIFLGRETPEALGDYIAGTNHVLPTSGSARFASPLGVYDFVKRSSFIYYTKPQLEALKDRIGDFSRREGLEAHAKSVEIRFEESKKQ